ncbi:hypothetical protein M959_11261, partial [Chaetura pelagica]
GLPGNQTPPHRHSALLAQIKGERAAVDNQHESTQGLKVPEHECEAVKRAVSVQG